MKARILSIDKDRALIGIQIGQEECGGSGCSGCGCASGVRTMTVDLPEGECWRVGQLISVTSRFPAVAAGGMLLGFPFLVTAVAAAVDLPPSMALLCGFTAFLVSTLFLKFFRKGKSRLRIERLESYQSL